MGEDYFDWDELPGCCGICVIFDFDANASVKEMIYAINREIEKAGEENFALILASTIPQQKSVNEALKKSGFTKYGEYERPIENNTIILWRYELGEYS